MDFYALLLPLAAIGIALGWERALPVKPIRSFVILRFDWAQRKLPFKFISKFFVGMLGCSECLTPYVAATLSFGYYGLGWHILLHTFAAYSLIALFSSSKET